MLDFDYCASTKVYFGKGKEKEVGKIIKDYGFKKVLLHYGSGSIKKTGLYDVIVKSLNENDIEFIELGGVLPNPDISLCKEGIKLCRENGVELILAVGGGSVLDSSKNIAHGVFYEGDSFDLNLKKYVSNKALPVGAVLTISAAGSEMSTSCVISNRVTKQKRGFNTQLNRPLFAIEDPELTYTVSTYQTGCGITDIISHTFERYFNKSSEIEFADYIAEGLIKSVMDAGRIAIKEPCNYDARAVLMVASSFSHNGLTSLGKNSFMPIHQLEHELSALNDKVAHGAGLAVLIPAWMKVCYKYDKDKFVKFAKNVTCITEYKDEDDLINKSISKMKELFVDVHMPTKLSEFGITESDIEIMANRLTDNGNKVYDCNIPLTKELALEIYKTCL